MNLFKILLISAGFLCAGLGTAGIFLPLLPTTPFYLAAAFCFARGSDRFHCWFTSTRLFKKYLASYANNRSMTLKTKLAILVPVTIILVLTAVMINSLIMRIAVAALLLVKYWYFIFIIKINS